MNVAIILAVVGGILFLAWLTAGRTWWRLQGTRIVECPETQQPAAVEIDARHAARVGLVGLPEVRVAACTRWPERADCGQECLTEIERSPEGCALKTSLAHWYEGRDCASCGKAFGTIHWHDHRPCLLSPGGAPLDWTEFHPEDVENVLATHRPICWNCYVAAKFRRDHGDRVVDRHRSATR